jgi:SagB-type dehydrogenase family enzyme
MRRIGAWGCPYYGKAQLCQETMQQPYPLWLSFGYLPVYNGGQSGTGYSVLHWTKGETLVTMSIPHPSSQPEAEQRPEGEPAQPTHIGQEFMEKTRYRYSSASDQQRGLPQPPLEIAPAADDVPIDLPQPSTIQVDALDLRMALEGRVSVRRYDETPLTLTELSFLLWCTQGVKSVEGTYATMRTVPSAGARHALETYLLANRVQGLAAGLYRFLAIEHKLIQVDLRPGIADQATESCWGQQMVKASAVTFIWVAVPYRMTWRYGQRGYRYMHLDAGHVCQNLYLAAQSVACGACAIAAFSDEGMNQLLGLDGIERFVIYLATVGKVR